VNPTTEQQRSLVTQVRQFGDLNTNAILEPTCQMFSIPTVDGFIGYRIEENCAIVFGDPLCEQSDQLKLAKAFKKYCDEHDLNTIYTIISEQFANSAIHECGSVCVQFGHKVILDPNDSPMNKSGEKASLVRRKVRHALKTGVVIEEYHSNDLLIENAITEVGHEWLNSRHGPQIHIAHLNFFKNREGKRWFYAKLGKKIVGFLILNELQSNKGWLLNNLISIPEAPGGTSELLIISCLEILKQEKCTRVIAGPLTSKQIDNVIGLGTISSMTMRMIFKIAKKVFYLDRQTVFWEKFQPKTENCYIMFDKVNFKAFKGLFSALNVEIL
jgi:lysylphosphatidylglycerol synthetase-like protein (DUF2156 family)